MVSVHTHVLFVRPLNQLTGIIAAFVLLLPDRNLGPIRPDDNSKHGPYPFVEKNTREQLEVAVTTDCSADRVFI